MTIILRAILMKVYSIDIIYIHYFLYDSFQTKNKSRVFKYLYYRTITKKSYDKIQTLDDLYSFMRR